MIDFALMVLAVIVGMYINSLLFILFRANKYEDVLANKVASAVAKENGNNETP